MMKILIVEDEQRVAELLGCRLDESGYEVKLAYDGEMALRILKFERFDIIISDIILPKINGFERCKEVRTLYGEIPILMPHLIGGKPTQNDHRKLQ